MDQNIPLEFCTEDNVPDSLGYVNQFIASNGLGQPLEIEELDVRKQVNIINTVYTLLKQKQEDLHLQNDLEQRLQKHLIELETSQLRLTRTEKRAVEAEREVDMLRARLSSTEATLRSTATTLKETKAELQKTLIKTQSRHSQYIVDQRKKEREFAKLQDRLTKSVTDRSKDGKSSIRILNAVKPTKPATARSATDQEEEATKLIATAYEEREKEFLHENTELRHTLLTLQRKIESLVDPQTQDQQTTHALDTSTVSITSNDLASEEMEVMQLKLPYELVRGTVQENTNALILQLEYQLEIMRAELEEKATIVPSQSDGLSVETNDQTDLLAQLQEMETTLKTSQAHFDQEVDELRAQISEHQLIIAEQEKLLQLALESNAAGDNESMLNISGIEVTSVQIAEQRAVLDRQQQQLEQERKALTAIAMEIGEARERLQRERLAFEEARRNAETQLLLQSFPGTPEPLRRAINRENDLPVFNPPISPIQPVHQSNNDQMDTLNLADFNEHIGEEVAKDTVVPIDTANMTSQPLIGNEEAASHVDESSQHNHETADVDQIRESVDAEITTSVRADSNDDIDEKPTEEQNNIIDESVPLSEIEELMFYEEPIDLDDVATSQLEIENDPAPTSVEPAIVENEIDTKLLQDQQGNYDANATEHSQNEVETLDDKDGVEESNVQLSKDVTVTSTSELNDVGANNDVVNDEPINDTDYPVNIVNTNDFVNPANDADEDPLKLLSRVQSLRAVDANSVLDRELVNKPTTLNQRSLREPKALRFDSEDDIDFSSTKPSADSDELDLADFQPHSPVKSHSEDVLLVKNLDTGQYVTMYDLEHIIPTPIKINTTPKSTPTTKTTPQPRSRPPSSPTKPTTLSPRAKGESSSAAAASTSPANGRASSTSSKTAVNSPGKTLPQNRNPATKPTGANKTS